MDILFINSFNLLNGNSQPELGQLTLATILAQKGYETDLIDFDLLYMKNELKFHDNLEDNLEAMSNYVSAYNSRIISFYTMCNSYAFALKLAERIKKKSKDTVIIFAGPHATSTSRDTLKYFSYVDIVARGEGEGYVDKLVYNIINQISLENIRGITYRNGDDIIENQSAEVFKNLDSIPFYNDSILKRYPLNGKFVLDVGRGCPFNCTFCTTNSFWNRNYRLKSCDNIISEMLYMNHKYSVADFNLNHDMFTMDRKRVMEFCSHIMELKKNIRWSCSARVDTLDKELVHIMAEAGCESIYIGIETGSQRMQRVVNKNLKLKEAMERLKEIKKAGIRTTISFIYGFADETEEDIRATLRFIAKLYENGFEDIQLHKLAPYPGTKEFNKVASELILLDGYSDVSELKFFEDFRSMIEKYPAIFSSFYDFPTHVREKYYGIEVMIRLMSSLYSKYRWTIMALIDAYKGRLDEIFNDNRNIILNLKDKMKFNTTVGDEYSKSMRAYFADSLKKIIYRSGILKGNPVRKTVYTFEDDIYRFLYFDQRTEIEKYYDINVIKYVQNRYISDESGITVKFIRKNSDYVKVSRIA